MKKKNIIVIIIGICLVVFSILILFYIVREKVYCGTVSNKINALEYNKNTTRPDPILIVKFDINNMKKEIHTNWITYTESEVGDRICFSKHILEMEPIWIEEGLLGLIFGVILVISIVVVTLEILNL